jgi:signal peptidase II
MLKNAWGRWLLISAIVLVLDVYTKHLIQQAFQYGEHLEVSDFFDLVRYHNEGAAFSFLATEGGWQRFFFSAIAFIASVVMIHLLRKNSEQRLFCFAIALVLGGAIGNLYDRLTLGYVVDFLFFHIGQYYWPAFNLADSAITGGVALLLLDGFKKPK